MSSDSPASSPPPTSVEKLKATASSTLALLAHSQLLLASINTQTQSSASSTTNITPAQRQTLAQEIPPLALLHDTTVLAKAHTTKLALLVTQSTDISETASATWTVLNTIQSTIIPTFMIAIELLCFQNHGKTLLQAATRPVSDIFNGLADMINSITSTIEEQYSPLRSKGVKQKIKTSTSRQYHGSAQKSPSIVYPSTGLIWSAADQIISLKSKGLVGLISDKLKSDLETINDATSELKDFFAKHSHPAMLSSSESSSPRNQELGSATSEAPSDEDFFGHDGDFDDDDLYWEDFGTQISSLPRRKRKLLPENTKDSISSILTKLKTLSILLTAIRKKRLLSPHGPTPDPSSVISPSKVTVFRLEKLAELSSELTSLVDDVVYGFYEWENHEGYVGDTEAQKLLVKRSVSLASLIKMGWNEAEDGSSRWFDDCITAIQR